METKTLPTAEELKVMSREMSHLSEDMWEAGNKTGSSSAEKVGHALSSARKAAAALETGKSLGGFEGSAKREIKAAVAMYEAFKATL